MIELVQLDKRHEEFAKRKIRIVAASVEGLEESRKTQSDCPNLTVLADHSRALVNALGLVHKDANPYGGDAAVPTTILVRGDGTVAWIFHPDSVLTRISPDDLLAAIDAHAKPK